jgi:hypothetical protein
MSASKAAAEPVEDFLNEDDEIPSQRFVLLSFISPENVLESKDMFFIETFLKDYEIQWKTKYMEKFIADHVNKFNAKLDEKAAELSKEGAEEAAEVFRANRLQVAGYLADYQEMLQKNKKEITATKLQEDYKDFMFKHQKDLEDKFHAKNNFRTTIRGMKVRGSYSTEQEAVARAKKLQRSDPIHHIFVGNVGKWLPWDPNPNGIKDQVYANDQLNQLMKKHNENDESLETFYKERNIKRPEKQVITDGGAGGAAGEFESIFGGPGDLAIQRKIAEKEAADAKKNTLEMPAKPVMEVLPADSAEETKE